MSKKAKKAKIDAIKENIAAYRRGLRNDELEAHNGKSFTAPKISENKKDKEEKRNKAIKAALKRQNMEYE